jgi:hypothetical protein
MAGIDDGRHDLSKNKSFTPCVGPIRRVSYTRQNMGLNKLCCRAFGIRHGLALLKEGRAFALQQNLIHTVYGSGFAF